MAISSFNLAPGISAEEIAKKREIARMLIERGGSNQQITHWTQGLNNAVGSFRGGYDLAKMNAEDETEKSGARSLISGLLDGDSKPTPKTFSSVFSGGAQPLAQRQASPSAATPADTISMIKNFEGYTPQAKWDYKQYSSGYGTRGRPGETVDRAEAERRLMSEVTPLEQFLDGNVKVPLSPQQRSSLVSFGYNLGQGALQKILPTINEGNFERVAERMRSFNQAGGQVNPGLVNRRNQEAAAFVGGMPQASPSVDQSMVNSAAAPTASPTSLTPPAKPSESRSAVAMKLLENRYTAPYGQGLINQALTPAAPYNLSEGETRFDGSGRVIARGGEKRTDDIREYDFAKSQGFDGSFVDFTLAKKKASAQNLTIDQRGENAFAKKSGEKQAESMVALSEGGRQAQILQADFSALKEIGARISTGKVAEVKALLGPYAEAIGVNVEGLGDMQAYEAITAKIAPRLRPAGAGATSDYDAKQYLRSIPSLGRTAEGNALISQTFEALSAHNIKAAEIADAALAGEITPKDANLLIRELGDPYAAHKEYLKKQGGQPQASPASEGQPEEPAAAEPQSARPLASVVEPPAPAIEMLRGDPSLAPMFDEKFGAGSAKRALGQSSSAPDPQVAPGQKAREFGKRARGAFSRWMEELGKPSPPTAFPEVGPSA